MKLPLPSLVLLLGLLSTFPLLGQLDTPSKVQKLPFHGKLLSVSPQTQTITIAEKNPRTFYLTPTTRITDGSGNPSNLAAAVTGEDVEGSYVQDASGRMTLFSVQLRAKTGLAATHPPPAASTLMPASVSTPLQSPPSAASTMETDPATGAMVLSSPTPHKQKFSGKVVSASSNSLVVHGRTDQTFTLTPNTKITHSAGKRATPATLKPGDSVTGTYVQSPDGALTADTLKVGK
jgi:hypothetical protein